MKRILLLLMLVTSMAYGQVSNTTATNFTNSLEASRIFNLPALVATPPVGIKAGGLSYSTVFQKIAVWNGTAWVYLLSEANADTNYIRNNMTNTPEAKRISVSDSIKTTSVFKGFGMIGEKQRIGNNLTNTLPLTTQREDMLITSTFLDDPIRRSSVTARIENGFSASPPPSNYGLQALTASAVIKAGNTQNWPVAQYSHPIITGISGYVLQQPGVSGNIPKGAVFYGTAAGAGAVGSGPSGVLFDEFNLIDLTYDHTLRVNNASGLRISDVDLGINGNTFLYMGNGDAEHLPNGLYGIYSNTAYNHYFGTGNSLFGSKVDNGANVQIFHTPVDALPGLTLDGNQSVGGKQISLKNLGAEFGYIDNNGRLFGGGVSNFTSINNASLNTTINGVIATRNIADANTAFTSRLNNAGSTGKIFDAQLLTASKFSIDYRGIIGILGTPLTALQSFRTNAAGTASEAFTPQSLITLTTTGTGAATFNQGTGALNIPVSASAITVDPVPTSGSTNAVSSGGTFNALASKANLNGGNTFTGQQILDDNSILLKAVSTNRNYLKLSASSFNIAPNRYLGYVQFFTGFQDGSAEYDVTLRSNPALTSSINLNLPTLGGTLARLEDIPAGTGGTVTSFSKTDGFGVISSVANPTTTPNYTIRVDSSTVRTAANSLSLAAAQTKLNTKQNLVTLTTTGSGAAIFNQSTGALNIPTPSTAYAPVSGSANYIQNQVASPQSGAGFNISGSGTIGSTLNLTATSNTANTLINKLYFTPSAINVESSSIRSYFSGANWFSGSKLSFYTNPGPDITATNTIERMVIFPNGYVGIGASSPVEALDVVGKIRASVAPTNPTDVVRLTDLGNYVNTTSNQTGILGNKTWSGSQTINNSLTVSNGSSSVSTVGSALLGTNVSDSRSFQLDPTGLTLVTNATTSAAAILSSDNLTVQRQFQFPNVPGTLALVQTTGVVNNYVASGNGSSTSIVIPHGLSNITTSSAAIITPKNPASAGVSYYSIDATNVTIVYTVAPVSGTNNLNYSILIRP